MLISVIVPVYNVEKYLGECIDSVLHQTYKELEIILVDDGSKDSSGKICDGYAEKYENITVIHKENAGLGFARNTGLDCIHGKYVTFLDSDDYLKEDAIEMLYDNLKKNQVDMCKSGFRKVDNNKGIINEIRYDYQVFEGEKAKLEMLPRMIGSLPDCKDSIEMAVCASLYNVEHIRKHNIRFPSERQFISEDLVFNIDYMQYAHGACTLNYIGYNYRYNIGSLTTQYREDRYEASKMFYLEMKRKLISLSYDDSTMLRLSRMLFVYTRMSIAQECLRVSKKNKGHCKNKIKKICNDEVLRQVIDEYPVYKLGIKQRVFLRLIKYKCIDILAMLSEKGVC